MLFSGYHHLFTFLLLLCPCVRIRIRIPLHIFMFYSSSSSVWFEGWRILENRNKRNRHTKTGREREREAESKTCTKYKNAVGRIRIKTEEKNPQLKIYTHNKTNTQSYTMQRVGWSRPIQSNTMPSTVIAVVIYRRPCTALCSVEYSAVIWCHVFSLSLSLICLMCIYNKYLLKITLIMKISRSSLSLLSCITVYRLPSTIYNLRSTWM